VRALIIASVAVSLAFLLSGSLHLGTHWSAPVILKVGSISLLILLAVFANPRGYLLISALVFSAVGDYLLAVSHLASLGPAQLFLAGLISFLIAHLFYISLFATARSNSFSAVRKVVCTVVVIAAVTTILVLWPGLAEMRAPVLVYSIVLSAMVITAQLSRYSAAVAVGSLCFFASDTMLALSIFGHPFSGSQSLIWIAYYTAQLTITIGVTTVPKRFAIAG